jgi:5-methylcytosine-specific restriction endonuclease McrA
MQADRRSRFASTVDHIVPRALGGSNHLSNLVAVCRRCNFGAGDWIAKQRRSRRPGSSRAW